MLCTSIRTASLAKQQTLPRTRLVLASCIDYKFLDYSSVNITCTAGLTILYDKICRYLTCVNKHQVIKISENNRENKPPVKFGINNYTVRSKPQEN